MKMKPRKLSAAISTVLGTAVLASGSAFAGFEALQNGGAESGTLTSAWTDTGLNSGSPTVEYCDGGCGPVSDAYEGMYVFYTGATGYTTSRIAQSFDIDYSLEDNYLCQTDVPEDYIPVSGLYASAQLWFESQDGSDLARMSLAGWPGNAPALGSVDTPNSTADWDQKMIYTPLPAEDSAVIKLEGMNDADGSDPAAYWDDASVIVQCTYDWVKVSGRVGQGEIANGNGHGNKDPAWTFSGGFWTEALNPSGDVSDVMGELYWQKKAKGNNLEFIALPDSDSWISFPSGANSYCGPYYDSGWPDAVINDVNVYDPSDLVTPISENADVCIWFGNDSGPYSSTGDRGYIHIDTIGDNEADGDTGPSRSPLGKGKAEGTDSSI